MKTLIDLFAGCGGLSTGLEKAGFTPIFFNELVPTFAETYILNHNIGREDCFVGDIHELNQQLSNFTSKWVSRYESIDLVCGGPPCQGFSNANRQRIINDPRNTLYKEYLKFLSVVRPQFFIMENVRGMAKRYSEIQEDFRYFLGADYSFDYRLFNAMDFGVPQNRVRFIMIGTRTNVPVPQIFDVIESAKRSPYVLRDAIWGLPKLEPRTIKNKPYVEEPQSGLNEVKFEYERTPFYHFINGDRIIDTLYNHRNRYNNPRDIEIFGTLPQGGNSLHPSIAGLMPYTSRNHIFKDKYFKLREDTVCKTITSHMRYDCNMYIHPWESRGLSPREAARIQSFPDDYVFSGPFSSWYAQIGNAVPVQFAKVLGDAILKFIL